MFFLDCFLIPSRAVQSAIKSLFPHNPGLVSLLTAAGVIFLVIPYVLGLS